MSENAWLVTGNQGTDPAQNFLGTTDARSLVIRVAGSEAVRVDAGGNVGIGTPAPGAKLQIRSGAGFNSPQVAITQTTRNDFARIRLISGPRYDPIDNVETLLLDWDIAVGQGRLSFFVSSRGNIVNCRDNGRVGILTETPRSELDVAGTATVHVLDITGGADIAEGFRLSGDVKVEPGMVLTISDDDEMLTLSTRPFDSRVAGVVSGGGGIQAGVTLAPVEADAGWAHVALAGRVRCLADATAGPIRPGDLLTTSAVPGHAMVCPAGRRAAGVVLGKALSGLREGTGSVIALVSLQ